ncbi:MAG: hypothetical protein ABSB80_03860 [Methanoregula sp.]|jgi:hypothetical protein|uniref:hypothetical protein n=1 Tax=Methanoregula sp. TaxID=2052170 RepID=UPI003D0A0BA8
MKKLIASVIIFTLFCVTAALAAPVGMASEDSYLQDNQQGHGIMADVHDVVVPSETIREQRQDIRQDVMETHQDIRENLTMGHEGVQDQRQVLQQDLQENREAFRNNDTTTNEARENLYENLTAGYEAIQQEHQGMLAYFHQSGIALADNVTALRAQIQAERRTDQAQIANLTAVQREHLMKGYDVQIAAHSLMAMENLTGEIGPRVVGIADEINASESNITPLEQRIENGNSLFRFMFGGDKAAANQIDDQVALNQQRIQTLEQLMQNSTLQPDVEQAMQEQITVLQQEQDRLANLTATERNTTGLFWWI